jgi:hypothetical protein
MCDNYLSSTACKLSNNKNEYKSRHTRYYHNNREKCLKQASKVYYRNKDKILEGMKQKVECDECKSIVCKASLSRHKKSGTCKKIKEERKKIEAKKSN